METNKNSESFAWSICKHFSLTRSYVLLFGWEETKKRNFPLLSPHKVSYFLKIIHKKDYSEIHSQIVKHITKVSNSQSWPCICSYQQKKCWSKITILQQAGPTFKKIYTRDQVLQKFNLIFSMRASLFIFMNMRTTSWKI